MTRLDRTNAPHHVYRCFDRDERLVYVGSTADLFGRLKTHRSQAWWWPTVAKVKGECHPNGTVAREVEARAIREEVPRWNKQHKWAGRDLWSESDWHDWMITLLRDGMSAQVETAIKDFASLFGTELPERVTAMVNQAHAAKIRRREKWAVEDLRRQQENIARQSGELRELNDELDRHLRRQRLLAEALGIDYDDPDLMDVGHAIDLELAKRSGGAS